MNGAHPHNNPTFDQIADVAYQIYLEEGRPDGRAAEHWLRAEQLLRDGRTEDDIIAPDEAPLEVVIAPGVQTPKPAHRRRREAALVL